jgi:PAS domain S-box-containing protein
MSEQQEPRRKTSVRRPITTVIDYRAVFQYSTDMISCHDKDGLYLDVSPACETLLGYQPDELIGRSAYEYFHPDDLQIIQKSHETIVSENVGTRLIYRILKKSGEFTWFETTSRFVPDGQSGPRIYAFSRDVSGRVAFEILRIHAADHPDQFANAPELLSICAWTGQVQSEGNWVRLEEFLKQRFGIHVTHGMSEDASRRVMEQMRRADGSKPI